MAGRSFNRILLWLSAGVVLAVAAIILSDAGDSPGRESRSVILKDPEKVNRIIIRNRYDSTSLSRPDSVWLVSGTETANPVAVENILFAAGRLQVTSVLSGEQVSEQWNRVSVRFMHDHQELLEYDLYFDGERQMLAHTGSGKLFMVTIPGYGAIRLDRVFVPVPNHYHLRNLIGLLPGEIALLEVEIPGKSHFVLEQDSTGDYECVDMMNNRMVASDSLNDHSIRLLLSYFADIRYERILEETDAATLRMNQEGLLMARLRIGSMEGETHRLEIYPWNRNPDGTADMFRALVIHNGGPGVLVVNYIYLDVLMRELENYYKL
ncbi:MAG: hypothetical protein JXR52_10810 [Bacteroidales bacterium]|nr:hypothetical protein [Bacteroidales bacterium]